VPDYVGHGKGGHGFKADNEGQGAAVDEILARETAKEANLRARLTDLGVPVELRSRCYVHGKSKPSEDTITMPWEVIYHLIESEFGNHSMGAMG
jgi:hypothetical protein